MPSLMLWNLRNCLWMTKSLLRVKQNIMSPKHHISGYKHLSHLYLNSSNLSSGFFGWFTQFGGNFYCVNFDTRLCGRRLKGEGKGAEKNAKREEGGKGGRVSFPLSSRTLAFLSHLKLPFPPLQTPVTQTILILNFVTQLWLLNLFFCCFFSA